MPDNISLRKENKDIYEIVLVSNAIATQNQTLLDIWQRGRVILSFTDGTSQAYTLNVSDENRMSYDFVEFYQLLFQCGATRENAFLSPGLSRMDSWDQQPISQQYDVYENNVYQALRRKIALRALQDLNTDEQAKKNGITFFALGCGEGEDVAALHSALKLLKTPLTGFGIDKNPRNIELAKKNIQLPLVSFEEMDAVDAPDFIKRKMSPVDDESVKKEDAPLVLITMIGYGTRSTISGTYETVRLLQNLAVKANIIYITGLTPPVITRDLAKRIGFSVSMAEIARDDKLGRDVSNSSISYCLKKIGIAEQVAQVAKLSLECSQQPDKLTLDMSFHASPLCILNSFTSNGNELGSVYKVDLSYANIKAETRFVKELVFYLKRFTNLKQVILDPTVSTNPNIFDRLQKANLWTLIERADNPYGKNEVPPLSASSCRILGINDTLLQKVLFSPSPAAALPAQQAYLPFPF